MIIISLAGRQFFADRYNLQRCTKVALVESPWNRMMQKLCFEVLAKNFLLFHLQLQLRLYFKHVFEIKIFIENLVLENIIEKTKFKKGWNCMLTFERPFLKKCLADFEKYIFKNFFISSVSEHSILDFSSLREKNISR